MSARNKSIVILAGILAVSVFALSLIIPTISKQKPSDCTSGQVYDDITLRCREKTASERDAEELAKLEDEAKKGKQSGDICLTAAESWRNIGKTTCVVFYPEYFYRTGSGHLFIDEKQNYKTGFVAFFPRKNMLSWNEFLAKYNISDQISVYGKIETYEGHPQIKVFDLNQITKPNLINCKTSYGCIYKQGATL